MRTPHVNAPWQMQPGAAPGPPPPPPHALCAQCERIVGGMQAAAAAANSTYGAVVKDFFDTKVCPNLPPDAQTPCTHYIDTEMPALWAEIVDDLLDPETACTSMHMCSAAARASGAEANPLECKLCKQAAKKQIALYEQSLADKRLNYEMGRLKACAEAIKGGYGFAKDSPFFPICADVVLKPKPVEGHTHQITYPEPVLDREWLDSGDAAPPAAAVRIPVLPYGQASD